MKKKTTYLASAQQLLQQLDHDYQEVEKKQKDSVSREGYWTQMGVIKSLFYPSASGLTSGQIYLRLVVLDSLYSTNGRYAQFALEELAEDLYTYLNHSDAEAADYFYRIVTKNEVKLFSTVTTNEVKLFNFFTKSYGINKSLQPGSQFKSLLSKYAFYLLSVYPDNYKFGFPIYDSLALTSYQHVCKLLEIPTEIPANLKTNIESYVRAMDDIRKHLFDNIETKTQDFVLLDAYLWRLGKIQKGNITLLLTRPDFEQFVKNANLNTTSKSMSATNGFDDKILRCCIEKTADEMLKGISSQTFCMLYRHWKDFFSSK